MPVRPCPHTYPTLLLHPAPCSQHIDFGGVGTAVPDRVSEFRVSSVKAIGANGWRTAHNPVAKPLLDAADRQGLLVWSENRNLQRQVIAAGRPGGGPPSAAAPIDPASFPDPQYLLECAQMVLRDRNHPSIIIWCAGGRERKRGGGEA